MKIMFMGFAFVLVGCTMQLGLFIMASQVTPISGFATPPGAFGAAIELLGMTATLRTAHILTIGGLATMMLEPAKDLIIRLIDRRRPKD